MSHTSDRATLIKLAVLFDQMSNAQRADMFVEIARAACAQTLEAVREALGDEAVDKVNAWIDEATGVCGASKDEA